MWSEVNPDPRDKSSVLLRTAGPTGLLSAVDSYIFDGRLSINQGGIVCGAVFIRIFKNPKKKKNCKSF